jgi:hypothetical protein
MKVLTRREFILLQISKLHLKLMVSPCIVECAKANSKQLSGSKFQLPFTKSKKIFSLVEFGQAMQAVRSPSMVASSMRLSVDHSKLFSIRDFERAVVKLRNKKERKSSIAHSTPVIAPEVDKAGPGLAINRDDASGESSGAESAVGSSQEKDIEDLHTTTETTEHTQGKLFYWFICAELASVN